MTTRMTTRIPAGLAMALAARAISNHRSVNSELIAILEQALSGTQESQRCPHCSVPEGGMHHPDCHTQRKGKSQLRAVFDELTPTNGTLK